MEYSIVLSDELLKEFNAFKNNESYDSEIIEKLLSSYKSTHKTNINQMLRVGIQDESITPAVIASGIIGETLEELAEQTKYKLILDKERTEYPYVSINKDKIENNYTSTHYKNINRVKAQTHIKALLKNANNIFIYDKYISKPNNWNNCKIFFEDLVPRKDLVISYTHGQLNRVKLEIINIYNSWIIEEDTENIYHRGLHDRYIIIDNKVEIILTSGFNYLFDKSKDFTYIVRDLENG
ncbi:MAG: hypothetical protein U9P72_07180 [Campylobacterota bacterium]|nr:hypothetical protein [Campylobacterota bacterium]